MKYSLHLNNESGVTQRISYGSEFQLFGAKTEKTDSEYANDVDRCTNFMMWHFRMDMFEL